jgi:hypothetical protein
VLTFYPCAVVLHSTYSLVTSVIMISHYVCNCRCSPDVINAINLWCNAAASGNEIPELQSRTLQRFTVNSQLLTSTHTVKSPRMLLQKMGGTAVGKRNQSPHGLSGIDVREMDAARALLEAFPLKPTSSGIKTSLHESSLFDSKPKHGFILDKPEEQKEEPVEEEEPIQRRPRSGSEGLDYLAELAAKERRAYVEQPTVVSSTASSDEEDDSVSMPPPPPRRRPRSVSDPEGMEKYIPLSRLHLVLPTAILEEELAEAKVAVENHNQKNKTPSSACDAEDEDDEQDEDKYLTPDELIRRARSRVLQDLSENVLASKDGKVVFPHTLIKYKEVSCVQSIGCYF